MEGEYISDVTKIPKKTLEKIVDGIRKKLGVKENSAIILDDASAFGIPWVTIGILVKIAENMGYNVIIPYFSRDMFTSSNRDKLSGLMGCLLDNSEVFPYSLTSKKRARRLQRTPLYKINIDGTQVIELWKELSERVLGKKLFDFSEIASYILEKLIEDGIYPTPVFVEEGDKVTKLYEYNPESISEKAKNLEARVGAAIYYPIMLMTGIPVITLEKPEVGKKNDGDILKYGSWIIVKGWNLGYDLPISSKSYVEISGHKLPRGNHNPKDWLEYLVLTSRENFERIKTENLTIEVKEFQHHS